MFQKLDVSNLSANYLVPLATNLAIALAIFLIGRMVARALVRLAEKLMARASLDAMLTHFISSMLNTVLLLFVLIAALEQMGVNTTSLVAILGAAGLAVGLALQGSLQNFAAGVMLLVFRPFKAGDFVEAAGTMGTVEKINIFTCVLLTPDNREIIVPNNTLYAGNITNYSARSTRRIDLVFGIGYGDDVSRAREIVQSVLDADPRVLKEPAPTIQVGELAGSSVNLFVRPWVAKEDYWATRCDLNEKVKAAFDAGGISIPFPQMDVHLDPSQ